MKRNLRNETCLITFCKVFTRSGIYCGKGYSIERSDGRIVPVLSDVRGEDELKEGLYEIRHSEVEKLVVVCWTRQ